MSNELRATLLVIVVFFGGSLPAYKLASESFGPGTTNVIRFSIACAVLSLLARSRGASLGKSRDAIGTVGMSKSLSRRLFLIGLGGIGLMAATMAIGVDKGNAVIASIVVGLEPIGVALAGVLMVREKPQPNTLLALVIGVVGTIAASGLFTERIEDVPVLSILLLLATVVTFSVYTALVRKASHGVEPLLVSARTQLGALALVVPSCLLDLRSGGFVRGAVTPKAVGGALFLGFGSALAYGLLCLVLAKQPSNKIAVSMFLTPVFGVLFSWLIVGEQLLPRHAVGALIVLVAVWVSEWAPRLGRPAMTP